MELFESRVTELWNRSAPKSKDSVHSDLRNPSFYAMSQAFYAFKLSFYAFPLVFYAFCMKSMKNEEIQENVKRGKLQKWKCETWKMDCEWI